MENSKQQQIWNKFSKLHWEKKPYLFKKFSSPLSEITEKQIFSMLVQYSDLCRKNKDSQGFKLYIDGQMQHPEDILQILPLKKDKTLAGYHQRMEKLFSDYCLVCDELLQVSHENSTRLHDFTKNLYSYVGFPNRFTEIGLYLGNYKKTPFGVHLDSCGVFSFPVVGKKSFRLWTPEFAKKNPSIDRTMNYSKFNKHSLLFEVHPGDMSYWPSSSWHIAESDGSFNATWSLGVWVDKTHQECIEEALKPLLISKLKNTDDKSSQSTNPQDNGKASILPIEYLNSISTIKKLSENDLHDAFLKYWLRMNSKNGFKLINNETAQKKISSKSKLKMQKSNCILWSKLKSNSDIIYAYQGRLFEHNNSPNFLKLIQELNLGKVCLVSDYLKGSQKKSDLRLLHEFANTGAFL